MNYEIGRKKIGADSADRRIMIHDRMRRRAEQKRDKSRRKILELRRKYKLKVKRNEEKMAARKIHREKLGPTCVSLMESREKVKQKRSAIGSLVPEKPKFSQAKTTAPRIYGKKFELMEKELREPKQLTGKKSTKKEVKKHLKSTKKKMKKRPKSTKKKVKKRPKKKSKRK